MKSAPKKNQTTVEQGRIEAHRHMIATIIGSLDAATRSNITQNLRENMELANVMALNLQASEEWIAGLVGEGEVLQKILEKMSPPPP